MRKQQIHHHSLRRMLGNYKKKCINGCNVREDVDPFSTGNVRDSRSRPVLSDI